MRRDEQPGTFESFKSHFFWSFIYVLVLRMRYIHTYDNYNIYVFYHVYILACEKPALRDLAARAQYHVYIR